MILSKLSGSQQGQPRGLLLEFLLCLDCCSLPAVECDVIATTGLFFVPSAAAVSVVLVEATAADEGGGIGRRMLAVAFAIEVSVLLLLLAFKCTGKSEEGTVSEASGTIAPVDTAVAT
jgi:hypothetical protein